MGVQKKGQNWFLDYRAYGRRIREKIGPSKKLAESVLAKRQTEIAERRFLDVRKASREPFAAFSKKYLDWVQGRIRTAVQEALFIRRLNRTFGTMALADIDLAKVEQYMAARLKEPVAHPFRQPKMKLSAEELKARIGDWEAGNKKTVSKSTVNREVACLRRILNRAAQWKLLGPQPLKGIKLFDEREFIRKRYLKPAQIPALLATCTPAVRNVVLFALYTGRRLGEILGMQWEHVDLENGYVYFPDTKKKEPDQVVLPPRAQKVLTHMRSDALGEAVFCRSNGKPLRRIQSAFLKAVTKIGLSDFHFHDLRHTAISYMIMNAVDLKTVAELVGHTTAEMVDRRYGHLSPDHKRAAAEIFGSAMDRLCGFSAKSTVTLSATRH